VKQGVSQGVLYSVKIPGCVFVQLKNVDLALIDSTTTKKPVMLSAQSVVRKKALPGGGGAMRRDGSSGSRPSNDSKGGSNSNKGKSISGNTSTGSSSKPPLLTHAPIRVIEPVLLQSNQAPEPVAVVAVAQVADVDLFDDDYWTCLVCEQQNDKVKFPKTCEVCLIDR